MQASSNPSASVMAASAPNAPASSLYKLASGDTLDVMVFQVPSLNRTVEIDGSGQVHLPLIGSVPAAGKTARELEAEVARRLGARYLQSPNVSVSVKEAVGQRITVDGAVRRPGIIQARGQMTLLRAVAEAQGFTDTADPSGVLIFRMTEKGRIAARFDVSAIRAGTMPDPPVMGGDTIVVDESAGKLAWRQFREALPVAGFFRLF
jgi:polysaccharide export outer membrane protein